MKTIYKCEICGYESESKESIEKCEAEGSSTEFSIGETLEISCPFKGEAQAEIVDIAFRQKTHEALYTIEVIWST